MPAKGSANNLGTVLREFLRGFRPGRGGLDSILDAQMMTLPLPAWAQWAQVTNGNTASQLAGSTTRITLETVPNDQRWWLNILFVTTSTGDNLPGNLVITGGGLYPAGVVFLANNEAGTRAYMGWPMVKSTSGANVDTSYGPAGNLLLEPGTIISLDPTGAGIAATVFTYRMHTLRTKLVRTTAA